MTISALRNMLPHGACAPLRPFDGLCGMCGRIMDDDRPEHDCCDCGDAGRISVKGRAVLCHCREERAADLLTARPRCGIPATLSSARIETWHPVTHKAHDAAQRFVETWKPERHFLVFSGAPGTGKTHLAVGVMFDAWERHRIPGVFLPTGELFDRLRATQSDDASEEIEYVHAWLYTVPLLVMDDLGTERLTEWGYGELFKIIDRRYRAEMPTVVTTNLATAKLDSRLMSRLGDKQRSTLVEMGKLPDHRRAW